MVLLLLRSKTFLLILTAHCLDTADRHWFLVSITVCGGRWEGWRSGEVIRVDLTLRGAHVRSLFPAPVLGEAEVVLGLGGGGGQHLAVTLLEAVLQLGVTHHQHVLLVPRHQAHLHTVQ